MASREISQSKYLAKKPNMTENQLSKIIVDLCYQVHSELGPGLFESVYEGILDYELQQTSLRVERQTPIPVIWKEFKMEQGFRADLVVNRKVLIEIKSVEAIHPVHQKQVLTYLKLTGLKLGFTGEFQ
ncbi:MAG: GxxExxY protein [Owenweeksia sp.]|nr:GxxExxY protein [Owenweeksia sp.]